MSTHERELFETVVLGSPDGARSNPRARGRTGSAGLLVGADAVALRERCGTEPLRLDHEGCDPPRRDHAPAAIAAGRRGGDPC